MSEWGPKFRHWVLKTFRPLIGGLGKITTSKGGSFSAYQVGKLSQSLQVGDVLTTRINGELTNFFTPGFYGHAAIVCAPGRIVESIGKGVRETSLGNFLSDKDHVGVFRSLFCGASEATQAGILSRSYVGRPYDYRFEIGEEAFYCSELVWQAYKTAYPEMRFCKREIFGVKTVLPDDFTCVRYWLNVLSVIGNKNRV